MRKQTYQCAQYKLKIVTKHDRRSIQVSMFMSRYTKVVINFAGMLIVARKQHMLLLETLKSYESAVVILK